MVNVLLLLIGFGLLIGGAEYLVRGASSIAARLKVSPLVIGLTIVALGTSMPELTVNVLAALRGSADLAIGNVVGSNIANILLVLGVTGLIAPLTVKSNTVWKEIPFALLGMVLLLIMGNDARLDAAPFNALTRTDGLVLIAIFIIFMYYIFGLAKAENYEVSDDIKLYSSWSSFVIFVGGLAGVIAGGHLLVTAAVNLATALNVSEGLIGLTVVAVGTSLPELATTVVAVKRNQNDIAVGNIVGSNIFNVFWVLGLTSVVTPISFTDVISFDVMAGILASMALFLAMFVGKKHTINRYESAAFLALYASYIIYVVNRG